MLALIEKVVWYLASLRSLVEASPFLRAVLVGLFLYQFDLVLVLGAWFLRKAGLTTPVELEPENRKAAVVVLPTLLRKRDELDGLFAAMRSVARNEYPGQLYVVACIDGTREAATLYDELVAWAAQEAVPPTVQLHVTGTTERSGKAVAMDHGIEHLKGLVARGEIARFPEIFFNMDADSALGERALERMVFRLTRRRLLGGRPRHIVTSNVIVPLEQCYEGPRSLLSPKHWIALSVAREYVGSISAGKVNLKVTPTMEVSGALYCTWSEIYLAAPRYAAFMQQLRLRDWLKWLIGVAPPRFSDFRGRPLPEAMSGPGDDTWMGWFACCCRYDEGHFSADFPRTPLHALAEALWQYVSRPVGYDPLAKVYSKTPTSVRALFKQRLRWNSSRMQDLLRHGPSLLYHWKAGAPLLLGTIVVFTSITLFAAAPLAALAGALGGGFRGATDGLPIHAPALAVLAFLGYYTSRLTGTITGLLISDSPRREWIKLVALPFSVPYHLAFNTLTLLIGYYRDAFGFGEPTTFAPESTLLRSNLSRFAIAYRLRRALWLAARSAVHGDVPFGGFWLGWRRSPFTPSGFDGWSTGKSSPAVYWPRHRRPATPRAVLALFAFSALFGALFFSATGTPARATTPPLSPAAGIGTWVWDEDTVLSGDARRDLLAFARAKQVGVLFVHAAAAYDGAPGFEALAALVGAASRQGSSVVLVGGDPSWSLPAHHADALAFLQRAARLRDRLAARGLPTSGRVLFDVEPYVLPQWRTARGPVIAGHVGLLRALREAGRAASLDVWHTIPFWFHEHQQAGRFLDELVLEQSAGVVVMAYRNREREVQSLAAPLLERAAKRGRPVVVAVETMCIDPKLVSFCGQTPAELASALNHLASALRSSPAFAGLAVHNQASWAQLERRAR